MLVQQRLMRLGTFSMRSNVLVPNFMSCFWLCLFTPGTLKHADPNSFLTRRNSCDFFEFNVDCLLHRPLVRAIAKQGHELCLIRSSALLLFGPLHPRHSADPASSACMVFPLTSHVAQLNRKCLSLTAQVCLDVCNTLH